MRKRSGIYPPGSKVSHEWITCKECGERALARVGGKGYCSRQCAAKGRSGPASTLWRGDNANYFSLHTRVYRARGKASHCERCGATDQRLRYEWANLTGHYEDIWDYEQMCKNCHAAYDAPSQPRGTDVSWAKLTEDTVREARRRHAAGESATSMAAEFGVSHVALVKAIKGKTWKHVPMEFTYRRSRPGPKPGTHYQRRKRPASSQA